MNREHPIDSRAVIHARNSFFPARGITSSLYWEQPLPCTRNSLFHGRGTGYSINGTDGGVQCPECPVPVRLQPFQIASDCQPEGNPIAPASTLGYASSKSFSSVLNVLRG